MENKPQPHSYSTPNIDPEFNATFCERLGKAATKTTKKEIAQAPGLTFRPQTSHAPRAPQKTPNEGNKACNKPRSVPNEPN